MRCERCLKREAMIHVAVSQNEHKNELFLCQECAHELFNQSVEDQDHNHLNNFMLHAQSEMRTCHHCGSTLKTIVDMGRFGCEHCYETFGSDIHQMINRVQHLKDRHVGKVPKSYELYLKQEEKIERLEEKLNVLIKTQAFEEAAVVRDEIKALKEGGNGEDEPLAE
ncbi:MULTISPECIES: UvrB/UvrC motif-containing protein [Nosocomiicoccus]|uniref:UvrB/UvrC motif-containing protein n=1 Tax=Nosocomiicoccus massiliensis TaxID=1232430 RepID=A0AAF0YGR3_9STAP|nr:MULTISPECIES: UvrB/UvrC motif-containing protein [Nosocomiicoccus]MDK6863668.1 UvrB/UvrC motif-containing protein [Nosocomiicoccus ampullae]OFL49399.1 hypothetical protein HMPREF2767_06100 [Nosocomiicoccus sp. HMSC067E10]OFO49889.1 hypothetical protein HMPREF3029_08640 [Nosocomiicoccus sp. HMSC059G07]OFS61525.1 hypothetical protein HMPREF3177_07590 [Nosocomiicoccus sp. HMSC09A07]WOS95563.1 UvrB/UvrC motif-containing protein [Nosocomiicoccus massiliensis]